MDAFASHGRTFLSSLPLIARSPAADFAKPANSETVLLSCNSADRMPKPPGSFMRCVEAIDVGELRPGGESHHRVAQTRG
jgi:hypothetical protein